MERRIGLHGYWRSSAAYRVRIALNLKRIDHVQITHDLRLGAQSQESYRAIQPQGLVPALETDDGILLQSPAILEWIEERFPAPPLLPPDAGARAIVRGMAAIIACDIHPLNNLRMLKAIRGLGADEPAVTAWIARWIAEGFIALETIVARHGQGFAFGSTPTLADCHLVPQIYSAERFGVDLTPYPHLVAAGAAARALPAFEAAHPSRQPDADPA
jgi:maleylpyruvate isomerase